MGARDLTTLENVKAELKIDNTDSDGVLSRRITACSQAFVQEIGTEILRQSYTETIDGDDERIKRRPVAGLWGFTSGYAIDLKYAPVIGNPTVTVDGNVIAKRVSLNTSGWVLLDGYRLEFDASEVTWGIANVTIAYEAGQYTPSEAAAVPATPYTVQSSQALGTFVSDVGVTKVSDGTALTKVASAPAAGQYSVGTTGLYTFAAADTGLAVSLSYAHLPSDIEDCVIEMVIYKFRKRERIDQVSANLGGQSVFFSREAWPITVQAAIDRWRRPPI